VLVGDIYKHINQIHQYIMIFFRKFAHFERHD
jgi:hypothetical protein